MALPIVLFFVVYHLNPDYVMLLFTDPLGRKMIAVAAFLQVMGAVCIKKKRSSFCSSTLRLALLASGAGRRKLLDFGIGISDFEFEVYRTSQSGVVHPNRHEIRNVAFKSEIRNSKSKS